MTIGMKIAMRVGFLVLIGVNLGYFISNTTTKTNVQVVVEQVPVAMQSVDAQALARELLTPQSYGCLMNILRKESNLRPNAWNKSSGAKGIGQLLTQTYTNLGMRHSTDSKAQLIATLAYIGRKYGSGGPCAAWDFHKKHNYY